MKAWARATEILFASLLLFAGTAAAQAPSGSSVHGTVNAQNPVHVSLTGHVRVGEFPGGGTSKPISYLYLELSTPIGKHVNNLPPSDRRYRNIELVGGGDGDIEKLEKLVGRKVTVRGDVPFRFVANAPSRVLPLVMLMDVHDPITVD